MKVVYNAPNVVFDLEVSAFGFLAFLMRAYRWHSEEPNFQGVLVNFAGNVVLVHPVYSEN